MCIMCICKISDEGEEADVAKEDLSEILQEYYIFLRNYIYTH